MESLNRMALELVDEAIDFADELAIETETLDNGATVLDFGVDTPGGYEAGLLLAELQTGGLATVQTESGEVDGVPIPHTTLHTDHPESRCSVHRRPAGRSPSASSRDSAPGRPARSSPRKTSSGVSATPTPPTSRRCVWSLTLFPTRPSPTTSPT